MTPEQREARRKRMEAVAAENRQREARLPKSIEAWLLDLPAKKKKKGQGAGI